MRQEHTQKELTFQTVLGIDMEMKMSGDLYNN